MPQSQIAILKDDLLSTVLRHAEYKTNVKSFKDLDKDKKALAIWNDKKTIRRQIHRKWPRNPNGEHILPKNSYLGKMTPNGVQFWGATLLDFFYVNRMPGVAGLISISTGSKLAKWMIEHKETEHAAHELSWTKQEADPREIPPYPISELIEAQEMRIRMGLCGKSIPLGGQNEGDGQKFAKVDQQPDNETKGPAMAQDVFRPEAYPAPWPLVPFSYDAPNMEHRIPLHRLPKKLVVHDPWNVLDVWNVRYSYRCHPRPHEWDPKKDITYEYKLSLSANGERRIQDEIKAREEKKEQDRLKSKNMTAGIALPEGYNGLMIPPGVVTSGDQVEPPIYVIYPIAPDPEPVEIGHLYLSPDEIIGKGHHSLVLHAEWEVPRSLLVPAVLCYECILEDVRKTLIERDGVDGSCKSAHWKEKSDFLEIVDNSEPDALIDVIHESFDSDPARSYLHSPDSKKKFQYSGPVRVVKTNVQWQNAERGPHCSHVLKRMRVDGQGQIQPHPPTARVSLVAKLSNGDEHLDNEAKNYEGFPQHLFEHWNGYNALAPLCRYLVPVGATVPQYYGYYELDHPKKSSMSPILLMENCGKEIQVENLREDDKHECAALFYRLHDAGYVHQSVYPRNVLCQDGPLDRPKYQRGTGEYTEDGRKHSFRLIDFGRSAEFGDRSEEQSSVENMLQSRYLGPFV